LNIAAQLTSEFRIGEHRLGKGWIPVLASNEATNKAGTNPLPSHLKDRLSFIYVKTYWEDVIRHFNTRRVSEKVVAYLRWRPEFLTKFDPDLDVCPSPRSWEKVGHLLNNPYYKKQQVQTMVQASVGEAAMRDFNAFLLVWEKLPDVDKLLLKPDEAPVIMDQDVRYALCSVLAARGTLENAKNLMRYVERLAAESEEFAVFLVRDMIDRNGGLKGKMARSCDPVRAWLRTHVRELLEEVNTDE
jgi:hypothetical protein